MRAALLVSLTVNLLLVTSIVVARVDLSRRVPERDTAIGQVSAVAVASTAPATVTPVSSGPSPSADGWPWPDQYYRSLRSRGLSHEETILPIAGRVLSALFTESRRMTPYWQPPAPSAHGSQSALEEFEDRMRLILIGLYGEDVAERPEFAMLFRPLGTGFAFLSSGQQLEILRWQRALQREAGHSGRTMQPDDGTGCEERGSRRFALADTRGQAVRSVDVRTPPGLDPAQRFEYALRTSPLAARLRPAGLDETTFRRAFRLLESSTGARTVREHLEARLALRRQLGTDTFAALWSGFDPAYPAIAAALQRSGVAAHLVESVYAVVLDSEEALLSIIGGGDALTPAQIEQVRSTEYERLASLVGSEPAAAIQALRTEPVGPDRRAGRMACPASGGA